MNKKYVISGTLALALFATMLVSAPKAFAFSFSSMMHWGPGPAKVQPQETTNRQVPPGLMKRMPGIAGTVTAINGTSLTVSSRGFMGREATTTPATTITYTVDASNATVMKNNATSTVSAIAVNDTVFVQGTITGTNVVATKVFDGRVPGNMIPHGTNPGGPRMPVGSTTPQFQFQGNGQPIVGGTVSVISGNTITITNSGSTTYTVDATNAKIEKRGIATSTISNISTGDHLLVQGAVNGTAITATTIIDQPIMVTTTASTTPKGPARSVLGSIGSFFTHLFGF
jgi:hypothetical protein